MIALLKYGTGVPFKRLERLQEHLGMPLPAATQWDLMAATGALLRPVLEELIREAAQGRGVALLQRGLPAVGRPVLASFHRLIGLGTGSVAKGQSVGL